MVSSGRSSNKKAIEFVRSMGLPNLITLARLLAVPLVIWLILAGRMTPAFWIFVVAGLSDAADGFFGSKTYKQFDGVLATYHDQGLAPFKALSFGKGVNFTAGLSHIRTSPDHGTGYDIAGKNMANSSSFSEALFTKIQIFKTRNEHAELTENPLAIK